MLQNERREIILQKLASEKSVRTTELCELFNISRQTAHKDIDFLASEGKLKKVHGGGIIEKKSAEPPFQSRNNLHLIQKEAIVKKAVEYVQNGDTIYLDIGTTINHMLPHLKNISDLTIITNSVYVAYILGNNENISIILSGGIMRSTELSLSGSMSMQNLERYYVDKSFFGIGGFSNTIGYTDYHIEESDIRRLMLNHSNKSIALLDYSKFDVLAISQFAKIDEIDVVVTDEDAPEESIKLLREADVHVDVVDI
ncbi:DeoR/GlpR family DNA-binding transcription regulator [Salinicoccus albus]|uniref:DeoR/GlpR family DNA-binding transcription regulator n=1 Tax=Salinicoccus albus TaxID=418756 RepID=UPI000371205E|nr:DeoR/GlpR family DNA-binding transcription regulator [Salinicoccus albus]